MDLRLNSGLRSTLVLSLLLAPFAVFGDRPLPLVAEERGLAVHAIAVQPDRYAALLYESHDSYYERSTNPVKHLALVDLRSEAPRLTHQQPVHNDCTQLQALEQAFALICASNVEFYRVQDGRPVLQSAVEADQSPDWLQLEGSRLLAGAINAKRATIFQRTAQPAGWELWLRSDELAGNPIALRGNRLYALVPEEGSRERDPERSWLYGYAIDPESKSVQQEADKIELEYLCCAGPGLITGDLMVLHDFEMQQLVIVDLKSKKQLHAMPTERYHAPQLIEETERGFTVRLIDNDAENELRFLEVEWNGSRAATKRGTMQIPPRLSNSAVALTKEGFYYLSPDRQLMIRRIPRAE